jgi:hypothetical protein
MAGAIPAAYTHIAKSFFQRVKAANQLHRIEMVEWLRSKWTYGSLTLSS